MPSSVADPQFSLSDLDSGTDAGQAGKVSPVSSSDLSLDVGRVHELRFAYRFLLQCRLQVRERAYPLAVVLAGPALGDGIDRLGVLAELDRTLRLLQAKRGTAPEETDA
jgi:hypothetical protein